MTIRQLRDQDSIPNGTPARYLSDRGYVRLRWRTGVNEHVEVYEHRLVMGRPPGMEIHHLDGVKHNNDPNNLLVLTPAEHARLHIELDRAAGKFTGKRRDRDRAQRRAERDAEWARRTAMYEAGMSTVEIGRIVGLHASNIYRGLRRRGVSLRTVAEGTRLARERARPAGVGVGAS